MPTKTKKRKYYQSKMVELSLAEGEDASDEELTTAAKGLGVSVSNLKQIIAFSNHMRDEVVTRDLTPPQVLSTCLGIVSEVIAECYAKDSHERICSDIYSQLRDSCGLKIN
jgi:hypothetical protein